MTDLYNNIFFNDLMNLTLHLLHFLERKKWIIKTDTLSEACYCNSP